MKTAVLAVVLACLSFPVYSEQCLIGSMDCGPSMAIDLGTPPPPTIAAVPVTGPPLRDTDWAWVDANLSTMTLTEKIGQMIMPSYSSLSSAQTTLQTYGVGGFIFLGNSNMSASILSATNALQTQTTFPLIFSIDCEPGLGGRVLDATRMPMNMAMGATRSTGLAYQQGKITARECRAIGVQIGFGPCVDVNTEPVNPIIGLRSYSDNHTLVTNLARAHVQGAATEGMLCTFKHYPGHGATTGDSHTSLQVVNISAAELQARHISPYAALVSEGWGDLVMSAHVWYPALDPGTTAWPATLSTVALSDILRTQLGFTKVIISDSYGMAGLRLAASSDSEAVRLGVEAGLDIILMPPSVQVARDAILGAYNSGQITMDRINQSVRRILAMKSRVGLPEMNYVPDSVRADTVGNAEHQAMAKQISKQSICVANPVDPPVTTTNRVHCLMLQTGNSIFYNRYDPTPFLTALQGILPGATYEEVATDISSSARSAIVTASAGYDRTIIVSYDCRPQQPSAQVALISALLAAGRKVAYVSFGNPYHALQFPTVQNYHCAFCTHFESQAEMARILTGLSMAEGMWPVQIPGFLAGVSDADRY